MPTKYPKNSKHEPYASSPTTSKTTPRQASTRTCREIGERLDIGIETLRKWHKQAALDTGKEFSDPSNVNTGIRRLKRENAELRRANEILKTASA